MKLRHFFLIGLALGSVMPAFAQTYVTNGTLTITNEPTAPFPSVVAAAKSAGIPWEKIDKPASSNSLSPGDSVTALLTLRQKGHHRLQWLVYLRVDGETNNDSSQGDKPMVFFTATGNRFEYKWSPAGLRARTLGPFPDPDFPSKHTEREDRSAGIAISEGFLSLGLEKGAEAICRWNDLSREKSTTNFHLNFSDKPFDKAQIERDHKWAAQFGVTAEEERSVVAWVPAVLSYFGTVQQTPNLQSLFEKVVAMPSAWSLAKTMVTHHGIVAMASPDFQDVARVSLPKSWGLLSELPTHSVPWWISINDKPVVYLQMIVTEPTPPLLACGGIIEMVVSNPDERENYLTVRVISARYRPASGESTVPVESQTFTANDVQENGARKPWQRIAMIGASLSAGFTISEPFGGPKTEQYRLSRYMDAAIKTGHDPVQNFATAAFFMSPVPEGRNQIQEALEIKPTMVAGVDFLFWFCYGHGADEQQRLARLNQGLNLLEGVKCPLIIGDIPDESGAVGPVLSSDEIPTAATLTLANQQIRQWAVGRSNVVILPLAELVRAAKLDLPVTVHGSKERQDATRRFLQEDRLHPTPNGCVLLVESIFDLMCAGQPSFAVDDFVWNPDEILRRGFPVEAPSP